MINDILAFVSFGAFLLERLFNTGFLPRLLGVSELVLFQINK